MNISTSQYRKVIFLLQKKSSVVLKWKSCDDKVLMDSLFHPLSMVSSNSCRVNRAYSTSVECQRIYTRGHICWHTQQDTIKFKAYFTRCPPKKSLYASAHTYLHTHTPFPCNTNRKTRTSRERTLCPRCIGDMHYQPRRLVDSIFYPMCFASA